MIVSVLVIVTIFTRPPLLFDTDGIVTRGAVA
jgi:hypothetical protein